MWSDFFIYLFVVVIEPVLFCFGQVLRIDTIEIDWGEGNRLKIHELAIFVCGSFSDDEFVFSTDTEFAIFINTWFVCDDHTFFELMMLILARDDIPAEACRWFMDICEVSYTMSGSALEVKV